MIAFSKFARALETASTQVGSALSALAAIAVAAIVVILVFSSVQRYALAQPIPATEEIAAYLFVCCAFLSMMDGLVNRRHIRLLILWKRLPQSLQGWAMIAGHVATLLVLAAIIQETFSFAWQSWEYGARSYVASLLEWPWMMVIPVSLTTLALAIVARILGDLDRIFCGESMPESARDDEDEGI